MQRPFLKIRIINLLLITSIFFFLIGCKKEDIDISPKITDINGNWNGTTSLNEDVSFIVSNNSVTEFQINIATSVGSSEYVYLSLGDIDIEDYTFSYTVEIFGKSTITGEFISNSTSNGTFDIETSSGSKQIGTWTATKQ